MKKDKKDKSEGADISFEMSGGPSIKVGMIEKCPVDNPLDFPPEHELNRIPVVELTTTCAFPMVPVSLPIDSDEMESVISDAISDSVPVVVLFSDHEKGEPGSAKRLSRIGVIGRIVKQLREPGDDGRRIFLFFGGPRVKVTRFLKSNGRHYANLRYVPMIVDSCSPTEGAAYSQMIVDLYDDFLDMTGSDDNRASDLLGMVPPEQLLASVAMQLPMAGQYKNDILKEEHFCNAAEVLLAHLDQIIQLVKIKNEIGMRTHAELTSQQRENFIQQQISILQNEIGAGDSDTDEFKKRLAEKEMSDESREHILKEIEKLNRYSTNSPDYSIQYNYVDTILNLPWESYSKYDYDLSTIEFVLDRDHFGLERVKERILEQIAVSILRADNKAPILCLVGPPGVGKTSLGKSIAEAMGREYARVSFGGMHDEAEIRGHRRTYIGAMPGRILSAILKKKYSNPVIVLDEIDKIGKDFKGDPSTALLEVLDPEQNSHFHDNFVDIDYDLSNVLFIATANSLETISAPLRDRMEIISIPGYISEEKIEIALRHLVKKQIKEIGLEENEVFFTKDALTYIIDYYTRESGVRKLEKTISKVLRKIAVKKVRGEEYPTMITREIVKELLGKEEFNPDMYENNDFTGVVTGLAWTSVGGEILFIESSVTEGDGKLTMTGNLGNVMKESAELALRYLRAHSEMLGVEPAFYEKHNFHIHVPEGAIPKDGPSAGITMTTSLASSISGRKVRGKLAMTGEITLRGKVLPVGGIKEKIIAAKRAGISEIILSDDNRKDIEDVNPRYIEGLSFTYVKRVEEVLDRALLK